MSATAKPFGAKALFVFALSFVAAPMASAKTRVKTKHKEKISHIESRKAPKPSLTLSAYLQQVEKNNTWVQAASLISQAKIAEAKQGLLALSPQVFGNANYTSDQTPSSLPAFQGSKNIYQTYQLGLSKKLGIGTQLKLYYEVDHTKQLGTSTTYVPEPVFYQARPYIEITQPLLRDWLGHETQSAIKMAEEQAKSAGYNESFQRKLELSQAKILYWNLALARQTVAVKRDSKDRAQKLVEWTKRRAKLELTDHSDLYQAQAALQTRNLDLQSALDGEKVAALLFNSARGIHSERVEESLVSLDDFDVQELTLPKKIGMREDVLAAQSQYQLTKAQFAKAKEDLRPSLDLTASYALTGKDPKFSDATADSTEFTHPTSVVGLSLTMPLDFGLNHDLAQSYKVEQKAARLVYERKKFETQVEWQQLHQNLQQGLHRLTLAKDLSAIQKKKLAHEELRHRKGRTTTFQVLQFEDDYANAQLAILSEQVGILQTIAKIKMFGRGQ